MSEKIAGLIVLWCGVAGLALYLYGERLLTTVSHFPVALDAPPMPLKIFVRYQFVDDPNAAHGESMFRTEVVRLGI